MFHFGIECTCGVDDEQLLAAKCMELCPSFTLHEMDDRRPRTCDIVPCKNFDDD